VFAAPRGRATGVPRRARPSAGWLPIGKFSTQGRRGRPAARGAFEHRCQARRL